MALAGLASVPDELEYLSAEEVLADLDLILDKINRSRNTLAVPRKRTIDELMNSKNMVNINQRLVGYRFCNRLISIFLHL